MAVPFLQWLCGRGISQPILRAFLSGLILSAIPIGAAPVAIITQTNTTIRVMAANLTSGNYQRYEAPGIRIFQGLKPDIVAVQEFNCTNDTPADIQAFVNLAFGPSFTYYREPATYNIPNGIISRYPIVGSGSWDDPELSDRGFAWARLDVPGTNDLYVVSVHLKASSADTAIRARQSTNLVNLINASFPSNAWIILAGDCNISDPSEACYKNLTAAFSDSPVPADAAGDSDTNLGRAERYDYVFPSKSLQPCLTATALPSRSFANGLVFDSRVYTPLSDVAPVASGDSGVSGMQHMAVVRSFAIPHTLTNMVDSPAVSQQPASRQATQGTSATFSVSATGTAPLAYQWRFNAANLPSATGSSYTLANLQPADVGNYSVVITNSGGAIASSNAVLSLVVPAPHLDFSKNGVLTWTGLSNLVYTVQAKTNLSDPVWTARGTALSPTGTLHFTNGVPATSSFFRVVYP